jgi:hypothetical protein
MVIPGVGLHIAALDQSFNNTLLCDECLINNHTHSIKGCLVSHLQLTLLYLGFNGTYCLRQVLWIL